MTSPVIWQNDKKTITLIDLPRSIAAAQGTVQHPCLDELLSTPAIETPFTTNEPKTAAKKARLIEASGDHELHERYADIFRAAREDVRANHTGDWCLPRKFIEPSNGKRKRAEDDATIALNECMARPSGAPFHPTDTSAECLHHMDNYCTLVKKAIQQDELLSCPAPCENKLVCNSEQEQVTIPIRAAAGSDNFHRVPTGSSFFVGDCTDSKGFRAAIRAQADHEDSRKDFDLILLDPPWPNRSARRTHKTPGSTYGIAPTLGDVEDLLFGMDLDMLMADDCLVGIWITNKPVVREMVLGEGGLFATWGVQLREEWVWLKTTVHGEPVIPLDSVWRKPYEVLLLGRKHDISGVELLPVQTKVIIGVPDLHSRKPCLRGLIEPLMQNKDNYRALEVFARYLVAGWWSWGNECIKFNSTEHWRDATPSELTSKEH